MLHAPGKVIGKLSSLLEMVWLSAFKIRPFEKKKKED